MRTKPDRQPHGTTSEAEADTTGQARSSVIFGKPGLIFALAPWAMLAILMTGSFG